MGSRAVIGIQEERATLLLLKGMPETLTIQLNGQPRTFDSLTGATDLANLIQLLGLKEDRIAVEHNGDIVTRKAWRVTLIQHHDRLEIVHFVGGGNTTLD
jgi:sulfur carrier protein